MAGIGTAPVALHHAALRDLLLRAGLDLGDTLSSAIAGGRLGPRAYQRWLAAERMLCQAGASTTAAMASGTAGPSAAWAGACADSLLDRAAMAAADLRRTDGMAFAPALAAIDHWRDYQDLHRSSRPGLVLGMLAVHRAAMAGPARDAVSAVLELPFLAIRGATYLLHRRLQATADHAAALELWRLAPDPAAQRDLLAGAGHAAVLYRELLRAVLDLGEAGRPPRWRWPVQPAGGAA